MLAVCGSDSCALVCSFLACVQVCLAVLEWWNVVGWVMFAPCLVGVCPIIGVLVFCCSGSILG